jgi:hypothetical protein
VGIVAPTHILATAGSINRKIVVQAGPSKKLDSISKITRAKRVGGVAEHLSSKGKALSSNTSTGKRKKVPLKELIHM